MKGKGKWAVLLLVLGLAFAGCAGGGSTGGSSDEGAVAANDNPVLGTWQVSIDPQNAKIEIAPVTLGANSLEPLTSWTNQVIVTDLVNRAMATETPTLTLLAFTNLANGHIVPGSELVKNGGVVCTRNVDYTIKLGAGIGATVGALARTGLAGTCNILSGESVTISYGYGASSDAVWASPNFTTSIAIENHLNATLEKVRFWTGTVSGPGAAQNPNFAASYADYPLIQPQTGATYGQPTTSVQLVSGWTAGVCYTAWGHWNSLLTPLTEGCPYALHPKGAVVYAPGWMDPVCGRIKESVRYTTATNPYKFYMQLTGTVNAWNPNISVPGGDSRFDNVNYTTWYALMGYLIPDGGAGLINTWCSVTGTGVRYWRQGSMIPIKPGDPSHCGTLITDPHLPRSTYFSVNFGLEYADTIEKQAKTFWDAYKLVGDPYSKIGVGSPYMQTASLGVIFDETALTGWTAATTPRTGHSGSTYFPVGFAQQYTNNYNSNASAGFKKDVAGMRTQFSTTYNITAPTGFIIAAQYMGAAYAITNFVFFNGSTGTGSLSGTDPYITQLAANFVNPAAGMPKWAGEWGVAHYDNTGALITEGADADLDYWLGMIVLKVKNTAIAGDYGFIRFDASGNNFLNWYYNNQDASNHPSMGGGASEDIGSGYCVQVGGPMAACPGAASPAWSIYRATEYPNPDLPPGNAMGFSAYATGCPEGGGANFSCGGHQYVTAVVCVQ